MRTYKKKLDRAIASRFTCSLMSNAKWRKTFRILSDPALGLSRFFVVTVELHGDEDTDVRRNPPPWDEIKAYHWLDKLPRPEELHEDRTADVLLGGPVYYDEIEWIEIPARYILPASATLGEERRVVQQDIVAAARALTAAGQFPIELTDERLRLYGYR